jgi:hyaluronoglucosaminidase
MNKNPPIGIIEGFFGTPWNWNSRKQICDFLAGYKNTFYIYAPKPDPFLRKQWQTKHPHQEWTELKKLSDHCHNLKLKFGVGLSPFELPSQWPSADLKNKLSEKLKILSELNLDKIAILFDDMKSEPDLADKQADILQFVERHVAGRILFCPTFYCFDPILDKVFGARPENYLENLGANLSDRIDIFWTGEKVLSKNISAEHLLTVTKILKRKPIIWDNSFASDGPKYCKYIPLQAGNGLTHAELEKQIPTPIDSCDGWFVNPMNLSTFASLAFLSTRIALTEKVDKNDAFDQALRKLYSTEFANWLVAHQSTLAKSGLDNIPDETKSRMKTELKKFQEPAAMEVTNWLNGAFNVGPECLTD